MSMVSESQPAWAMVSAEKAFGIASQPLRTASPPAHLLLIRFARIGQPFPVGLLIGRRSIERTARDRAGAVAGVPVVLHLLQDAHGRQHRRGGGQRRAV